MDSDAEWRPEQVERFWRVGAKKVGDEFRFDLMLERVAVQLLNAYQGYIRIILPSSCRFSPSCSEYTKQAITKYGFSAGTLKGLKRLLRCHPFSQKAGYDPLV